MDIINSRGGMHVLVPTTYEVEIRSTPSSICSPVCLHSLILGLFHRINSTLNYLPTSPSHFSFNCAIYHLCGILRKTHVRCKESHRETRITAIQVQNGITHCQPPNILSGLFPHHIQLPPLSRLFRKIISLLSFISSCIFLSNII